MLITYIQKQILALISLSFLLLLYLGGQYYYRFGSIHSNLLGLEVVLADGTVLDMMSSNRKDNTGYHLKNLFVGSEGTLGFITRVSFSCPTIPRYRNAAFLLCHSFSNAQNVSHAARTELGEILAAVEFMDSAIIRFVSKKYTLPIPYIDQDSNHFYVLVETQGSNAEHDKEKMNLFLSHCMDHGYIQDGVLAQNLDQVLEMYVSLVHQTSMFIYYHMLAFAFFTCFYIIGGESVNHVTQQSKP